MDKEYVNKYYETDLDKLETSEKVMNIMMFSSQEQYDYIYVVMASLIANNPDLTVHLFIVSFQELVGTEQFNAFFEENGNILTYYKLDDNYVLPFKKGQIHTRTGLGGLIRPIAHTIIEPQYDKVLFMDADVVVLGDIYTDFYNLDFDEKYMIVTAFDYEDCNNLTSETFNYQKALNGSYFNSALLVLNLAKLRLDYPYEKVLEACYKEEKITNEQHILNALFALKSKYVDAARFHCRWNEVYKQRSEEEFSKLYNKMCLFHYDPLYVPYKSWDILFEDDNYSSVITEYSIKLLEEGFRHIVINKHTNDIMKLWWYYAEKTPHYDKFYSRMKIIREYFLIYMPTIINRCNRAIHILNVIRSNVNTDEIKEIEKIKKKEKCTWLNALNIFNSLPVYDYAYSGINYQNQNLEQYLENITENDDLVTFITGSVTCHHIINKLSGNKKLKIKCSPKAHESYLAILDPANKVFIEKAGTGILKETYTISIDKKESIKITANDITMNIEQASQNINVLIKSEGYNSKTLNSYNSIMINNIDYAQSIRGINIVVYSKEKNMVVDKCFVNNSKLQLCR